MIKKLVDLISKNVLISKSEMEEVETQTSLLQKKAMVYTPPKPSLGVPAPKFLTDDPWFGPAPNLTENQKDYMEKEMEIKIQEEKYREKVCSSEAVIEDEDIHQKMYEMATANWNTVAETQYQGGSENFHEGPGGWNSGTGMGQFKS